MSIKSIARSFAQGILSQLPHVFHRYLLSCYHNTPQTTLHSGYQVFNGVSDLISGEVSSSINFFAKSKLVRNIFSSIQDPIIFDVGANIGQTSSAYGSTFPNAYIHAFEPFAENFEHLKQNTSGIKNLRTHHLALSNNNGHLTVRRDHHPLSQWNSISPSYQDELIARGTYTEEAITLVTGLAFCEKEGIDSLFLLKVDTEGHEIEVLYGFAEMFAKAAIKLVLIEVGFGTDVIHGSFQEVNEFLIKHGMILCGLCDTDYLADGGVNYTNAFYCHSQLLHTS
jgi:FkbM family methyltransferase